MYYRGSGLADALLQGIIHNPDVRSTMPSKAHRDDIARNLDSAWRRIGRLEGLLIRAVLGIESPHILWNSYAEEYGLPTLREDGSREA